MSQARLTQDTLFLACTRPAMVGGVTIEAVGLNLIFSCTLFLVAGSVLYALVAAPIHLCAQAVCRHDPNAFRLLLAWVNTRGRHRNAALWGGSSCTPLALCRRRARELAHA